MRRVAVVSTASASGKTTLARRLAERLGVQCVELDALVHGPNWTERSADELWAVLAPVIESDGWVIDGNYSSKLGDLVVRAADTVVWLDLPMRVWFPRLLRRTVRRVRTKEELWNGNRESLRGALWGRDALIPFALRTHRERRRTYPGRFAGYRTVRLCTPAAVEAFLSAAGAP